MWGDSVKIQDFQTSEDIWNNSVYVIDRSICRCWRIWIQF